MKTKIELTPHGHAALESAQPWSGRSNVPGRAVKAVQRYDWEALKSLLSRSEVLRLTCNFSQPSVEGGCFASLGYKHCALAEIFVPGGHRGMTLAKVFEILESPES